MKNFSIKRRERGQTTIIVTILFLVIITFVILGTTTTVSKNVALARTARNSFISLNAVDSGQEDLIYRLNTGSNFDSEEVLVINDATATTTVTDDFDTNEKIVETEARAGRFIRKRQSTLSEGESVSFNYGVQVGQGGFLLKNGSSIHGNVYSSGTIIAESDNYIRGTVVSASSTGFVKGVHATSTVYSHTIEDSTIEGDAYYWVLTPPNDIWGTLYPDSEDQPERDLPISDETIESWKDIAETGGVDTNCVIDDVVTIGPIKYECDELLIHQDAEVTLLGMVWVDGDVTVENNATVSIDPSLGNKSLAFIADDEADPTVGGLVTLQNNAVFWGTGAESSQIVVISGNTDEEGGGTNLGIDLENNNEGDLSLYCNHCRILIKNNAILTSVTGYRIEMRNNAELFYKEGIASSIFDTGPGSSWQIVETLEIE